MARRLPSQPPAIPGFTYVHVLGSGGFADVFLYEQNMPRRQVAVKVMLSEVVNEHVRRMFQAEANLMAQLSSHPSILTVYQASVSADGRPYIVMELCSASLSARYRVERLPVDEVLRIAVRIGSAIETAHRAGVLHRDIKPSNILTTAYGHPVLSDFGIAATLSESSVQESVGLSIPWSAPEVLMDETAGSIGSEVWSFAATVYSLLAGRSPFEVVDGQNQSSDLIGRINRGRPHPTGRNDVPVSLERVLSRAMSRRPGDRPRTILELLRELQGVELELGLPQTPIEVAVDDWAAASVAALEDRTRLRPATVVRTSRQAQRRRRRAVLEAQLADELEAAEGGSGTGRGTSQLDRVRPPQRAVIGVIIAASVLVLALIGTTVAVLVSASSDTIPVVSNIAAKTAGTSVQFSWDDPGLAAEDTYQITTSDQVQSQQTTPTFTVDATPGKSVCITVTVNRAGRLGQPSGQKCVDVGN